MHWLQHPLLRPLLCITLFVGVMKSLQAHWSRIGEKSKVKAPFEESGGVKGNDRLVVAHFMLGNTYPFTEDDWIKTFELAVDTGLDGLALNLGPEDWQVAQASSAYNLLSASPQLVQLRLFISLDMNVLPSSTREDADKLVSLVEKWMASPAQLHWRGGAMLSTFGGQDATFGGEGWDRFLNPLRQQRKINFFPAFFLPPNDYLALEQVDGVFAWNSGWPMTNTSMSLIEDEPFLRHKKPYMAAVSPTFFTHYGTSGEWAYNKNWIYRSDDLLYPKRWSQLLDASAKGQGPEIIEVISWNDYGESHNIAPVRGAQPGSQAWTDGMDHEAFRSLTKEFARRWKQGSDWDSDEFKVFLWYRPHSAALDANADDVGRPEHSEWAQDLINVVVLGPKKSSNVVLQLTNGDIQTEFILKAGKLNMFTRPFGPGRVSFELLQKHKLMVSGEGLPILAEIERYNFNFWSGVW